MPEYKTQIIFQIYPKDSLNICILNVPESLSNNGFGHANDGTAYDTYCREIGRKVGSIYSEGEGKVSQAAIYYLENKMKKQIIPYINKLGIKCEDFFKTLEQEQIRIMFEKQCLKYNSNDVNCVEKYLSQPIYTVQVELSGCLDKNDNLPKHEEL